MELSDQIHFLVHCLLALESSTIFLLLASKCLNTSLLLLHIS